MRTDVEPSRPARSTAADERTLLAILDNLPALIGYWGRDLRNRYGNQAYRLWFGIDPARMPGMHIRDVIGEERYRLNLPYIEGVLEGTEQIFERAIPSPDGKGIRHGIAHYIPDKVEGQVVGFHVLVSDITAVKQAEAALREREERYRAVIEDITEVICRFLADGTITFVNDVYCRFFGRSAADLIGRKWQPVAHPNDVPTVERQLASLSPASPVVVIENRVHDGCGQLRWMQFVNRALFDNSGQLLEIQSVGRDITDRKAAEEALREAHEQMELRVVERTAQLRHLAIEATLSEERERQAIARDLHDDLGQLLHVARLKLDALTKQSGDADRPVIDELRSLVSDASKLVRSLTSQLSPPVLRDLGLGPALLWLGEELERRYGLTVVARVADTNSGLSPAQSAILFRAARELLINAAKHAGCRVARLEFGLAPDGWLVLAVEDDGIGLADPAIALSGRDSFGLASVRERILYLGGTMALDQRVEGGLRVTLRLPVDSPLPAETATAP